MFISRAETLWGIGQGEVTMVYDCTAEGALTETVSGIGVLVEGADGCKCDRCWSFSTEGRESEDGFLCAKCLVNLED